MNRSSLRGVSTAELAGFKADYDADALRLAMSSALYQTDLDKLLCAPVSARDLAHDNTLCRPLRPHYRASPASCAGAAVDYPRLPRQA